MIHQMDKVQINVVLSQLEFSIKQVIDEHADDIKKLVHEKLKILMDDFDYESIININLSKFYLKKVDEIIRTTLKDKEDQIRTAIIEKYFNKDKHILDDIKIIL